MSDEALVPGRSYLGRIGTKTTPMTVTAIKYKIDVNTRKHLAATKLELNDIAFCNLSTGAAGRLRSLRAKPQDRRVHHH